MLLKNQKGMSLVEVLVAVLLLGITMIPLMEMVVAGRQFTTAARHEVAALNFTQEIFEEIKGVSPGQIGIAGENAGGGHDTIRLAAGAEALKPGCLISITAGKGEGQVRRVAYFDEISKIATVEPDWRPDGVPDHTSSYLLCSDGAFMTGRVQSAGADTIGLAGGENSKDDFYRGCYIEIAGGTGSGQIRRVRDYNGLTKVAKLETGWQVAPDSTSLYKLYRYEYRVEVLESAGIFKTIKVTSRYRDKDKLREVSLTTAKLKR